MQKINQKNKHEQDKKLNLKKTSDDSICPYCSQKTYLIWIHGHYQCVHCKNVVLSCCEGKID